MGGGGGGSQTTGYRYYMTLLMGVCHGPVDSVNEIRVGDRTAWSGEVTGNKVVNIDQPGLFGGTKAEGGIQGWVDIMFGYPGQTPNVNIINRFGGVVPGYRRMLTVIFDGMICCNNPYPKAWNFRVSRIKQGWDGAVFFPALAAIKLWSSDKKPINAMNPAHILYQANTDRDWGRGIPRDRLDDQSFRNAAQQLFNERFGLCLKWSRSGSVSDFIQSILNHIGGALFTSRQTGLLTLKLIRDDYDHNDLPSFDRLTGLLGVDDASAGAGNLAANEVIVTWHDPVNNEDRQVRERNLGAIRAAGGTVSTKTDYPGIPTAELAHRVAARDVRANTSGAARLTVRLDRRGHALNPGDVFTINHEVYGYLVLRIGSIDYGTLTDGTVTVTAVKDVFGLPDAGASSPQAPDWTPPDTTPKLPPYYHVFEASYRDLILPVLSGTGLAADDVTGIMVSLAARPSALSLNYELDARVDPQDFTYQAMGDFTPCARLKVDLDKLTKMTTVTDISDGALVSVGSAALIGGEVLRVDAFDPLTGEITFGRGCTDTLPAAHVKTSMVWFFDTYNGFSHEPWLAGLIVEARMMTRTSSGQLPPANAPTTKLVMNNRLRRPYLPGLIQVNGVNYPDEVAAALTYSVTWANRDRILQADQLVDCTAGDTGIEDGAVVAVTITDNAGAVVWETTTTDMQVDLPYVNIGTAHWLVIESRRDGLGSWQTFRAKLPAGTVTAPSGDA